MVWNGPWLVNVDVDLPLTLFLQRVIALDSPWAGHGAVEVATYRRTIKPRAGNWKRGFAKISQSQNPTRAFSWLKGNTSNLRFKTLLRLYAKWAPKHSM